MPKKSDYYTVLFRTPGGSFRWWPAIQVVEFVPKRKRSQTWSDGSAKTFNDAMRLAMKSIGLTLATKVERCPE